MVPSLKELALAVCVGQAGNIADVGNTPYNLVKPILKRLNAKQLATLEDNSPGITPESDEIWGLLIEKDFSDRPFLSGKKGQLLAGRPSEMPNKAVYQKYAQERDQFRDTSAKRLRKITERLQREKTKNSITPIEGIIREPIRRRRVSDRLRFERSTNNYKGRSILGKAMKDIQHRLLMFGGTKKTTYDPFSVFKPKPAPPAPRAPRSPQKNPALPAPAPASAPLRSPQREPSSLQARPGTTSPLRSTSPSEGLAPEMRKRKQAAIFMPKKKPLPNPPPPHSRPASRTESQTDEEPQSTQRKVRSSVFY